MYWLRQKKRALFMQVPGEMRSEFELDCAQKNNRRFFILPIFCIPAHILYFIIYQRIHPVSSSFMALSAAYILVNIAFCALFNRLRKRRDHSDYVRDSHRLLIAFLVFFIAFQSYGTIHEVMAMDSIYFYLAAFFIVSFLPLLNRFEKVGVLTLFIAMTEIGLAVTLWQANAPTSRYQGILLMFFLVGVIVGLVSQNSAIRTFVLQQNLINANKKLSEANAELERMAATDALTQLANRRAFDGYISRAWSACRRDGGYLSIMMIDIDDFKSYNDRYGHQMGDDCLVKVAQRINSFFCRETDMVARYGGEEFVVLTVKNTPNDALALAEKVREGVQALGIEHKGSSTGPHVTVSLGLATATGDKNIHYGQIVKLADDALYRAKQSGKNRVEVDHAAEGMHSAKVNVPAQMI